jgi:hypothetical protein
MIKSDEPWKLRVDIGETAVWFELLEVYILYLASTSRPCFPRFKFFILDPHLLGTEGHHFQG